MDREASQLVAPVVVPIVHYVGPQIFANELHEPVALAVIECVVERLRCVGDLAQFRVSLPQTRSDWRLAANRAMLRPWEICSS
jgi:hypothetical protein